MYFVHGLIALGLYDIPMRARVLTQKSEEATASSASLLATPLLLHSTMTLLKFYCTLLESITLYHGST